MRLIAIPLARSRPGALPVSTFVAQRTPLPSAEAHATGESASSQSVAGTDTADKGAKDAETKKPPLLARLQQKAADFWVGLGDDKTNKSTFDWKRRTYTLGEKLMDRIEYEEWALKGVDPAVGPSVSLEGAKERMKKLSEKERGEATKVPADNRAETVPLLYPPSLLESGSLLSSLQKLTAHRTPYHRTRMWYCLIGAPFTAPFMLVPVIPNLPFFYVMWRAYSHFKAWKASEYLSAIIEQQRLIPTPSEVLDKIYSTPAPALESQTSAPVDTIQSGKSNEPVSTTQTPPQPPSTAELLLRDDHVPALVESLELDGQLAVELRRALMQTRKSIEENNVDKLEQAAAEGGREKERHAIEKKEQ